MLVDNLMNKYPPCYSNSWLRTVQTQCCDWQLMKWNVRRKVDSEPLWRVMSRKRCVTNDLTFDPLTSFLALDLSMMPWSILNGSRYIIALTTDRQATDSWSENISSMSSLAIGCRTVSEWLLFKSIDRCAIWQVTDDTDGLTVMLRC